MAICPFFYFCRWCSELQPSVKDLYAFRSPFFYTAAVTRIFKKFTLVIEIRNFSRNSSTALERHCGFEKLTRQMLSFSQIFFVFFFLFFFFLIFSGISGLFFLKILLRALKADFPGNFRKICPKLGLLQRFSLFLHFLTPLHACNRDPTLKFAPHHLCDITYLRKREF